MTIPEPSSRHATSRAWNWNTVLSAVTLVTVIFTAGSYWATTRGDINELKGWRSEHMAAFSLPSLVDHLRALPGGEYYAEAKL
ncbi:hypothetical protein [Thauera sp.]|uniref:hypothetical protein n=1 Tax=Thauera sp. TaxID=1905334 RepID=UPI002BE7AAD6|nr:hypothetical protein [Thauera sp.]HRP26352.1 hypothetical protein [Thauera sp.]